MRLQSHFQNFLDDEKQTLQSIVKPLANNEINVYDLLDDFVTYLLEVKNGNDDTMSISKTSIKSYMAAIKSFLAYYDIDIVPAKFKSKVKMPKILRSKEQAIDVKDIREILLHCSNRRLKPFLLCLASGGMRTNEATSLRIMDVDFTTSPTTVYIRNTEEHRTKTKEARFTFISDEATKYLKEWIAYRYRTRSRTHESRTPVKNDNDLIFADSRWNI